ncbi:hypothetical protein [Rhizobium sp. NZLR11]|uniref:hypothetical protein n=1 Tax=Rhizobium sp. NZLR11 TaxID=2731098 RepID=UPI001C83B99B|nr:hypothetical protein [Rhizobium sp. NZLR11]MBX5212428.1 hypothetical protein [Rhizobium sp. NZLR11]
MRQPSKASVEIIDEFPKRQKDLVDHLAPAIPRRRVMQNIGGQRVFDIAIGHVAHRMKEQPPSARADPVP